MSARSFEYACEKCSATVHLTAEEYEALRKRGGGKYGARVLCATCDLKAIVKGPAKASGGSMGPTASLIPVTATLNLSPDERDNYGVTVTVEESGTRRLVTLVGKGPVVTALKEVCGQIDALDGEYRVVSVSTPGTIFRDLQGTRDDSQASPTPEKRLLSKVGRSDLLRVNRRGYSDDGAWPSGDEAA